MDKDLLDGLERCGFKLDFGEAELAGSSSISLAAVVTTSMSAARI
jgi:hypothetical protein